MRPVNDSQLRCQAMTTVLAVRHADIDLPAHTADPPLSPAGRQRAQALALLTGSAGISSILTSEFTRTQQTAQPLAQLLGLTLALVPAPDVLAEQIVAGRHGDIVMIVGHSNTIPELINALGGGPVPIIGERDFDNLFVVTLQGPGQATTVRLRYGLTPA
jgi:broad specificity phosphatase PhoE